MVIILGQAKNYKPPPNNPGPKCRGEILIYIPGQKGWLYLGENGKT
jgi:hypothetical protein